MAHNVKLLLKETVDNLGIVGDVVTVRTGYARNYLLPREMAMKPSDEAIKALAAKRAEAEKKIAEQRAKRTEMVKKLEGVEVSLIRPCNDFGILYGAITQQEISKALREKGYEVRPRDVRLPHAIKRVDSYEVHIKFEADLEATIVINVLPDRELDLGDRGGSEPAGAVSERAPETDLPLGGEGAAAVKKGEWGKDVKASDTPAPEAKEKKGKKSKKE